MVLSFKKEFKKPILSGDKIHSIRTDKKHRWNAGRTIQMATGVRSKNYNCFKEAVCISTQRVFMTYSHRDIIEISIDGRQLFGHHERLKFAKNDGFNTWKAFFDWFFPLIKKHPEKHFSGVIVHWTNLNY